MSAITSVCCHKGKNHAIEELEAMERRASDAGIAACGGDNGDDEAAPVAPPPTKPDSVAATKVLFVGVDGATYDAWHRGVADKSLPGLAQLTLSRAWTGGVNGADAAAHAAGAGLGHAADWPMGRPAWRARRHGGPGHQERDAVRAPEAGAGAAQRGGVQSTDVAGLFAADGKAGNLLSLSDCAGADDCVASQARDRINEGYDVVVAQFGGPARVAAESGFGAGYDAELRRPTRLAALLKQIAERRAQNPKKLAAGRHQRLWPGRLGPAGRRRHAGVAEQDRAAGDEHRHAGRPTMPPMTVAGTRAGTTCRARRMSRPRCWATWAPCPPPTRTTWRVRPCRAPLRCVAHRCARPWTTSAWR